MSFCFVRRVFQVSEVAVQFQRSLALQTLEISQEVLAEAVTKVVDVDKVRLALRSAGETSHFAATTLGITLHVLLFLAAW